jgi:hypothetical protein
MRKLKRAVTSSVLLLCLHLAAASLAGQEAHKIEEIANPRCDLSEVPPLDPPPIGLFATALRDTPGARGAIVVFGMQGSALRYAEAVEARMIGIVGIAPERLLTRYGGDAEDRRMELWIIPERAAEPKFSYVEDTGKAQQFDQYTYGVADYCGESRRPALKKFAAALKGRPGWRGYIIVHQLKNKRGLRSVRINRLEAVDITRREAMRFAARDKRYVLMKSGLSASRLTAVVGGDDDWTYAELWLVPPGAKPPELN